jgi:hypothetical protein
MNTLKTKPPFFQMGKSMHPVLSLAKKARLLRWLLITATLVFTYGCGGELWSDLKTRHQSLPFSEWRWEP